MEMDTWTVMPLELTVLIVLAQELMSHALVVTVKVLTALKL